MQYSKPAERTETELREQLLSEAIAPHSCGTDETGPGVYVLGCAEPDKEGTLHAHARQWREAGYRTTHPDCLPVLATADRLVYVGSAANIRSRLRDHLRGDVRQTAFLSVYPPQQLISIEWFETAERAAAHEIEAAIQVRSDHPSWAVWADGRMR